MKTSVQIPPYLTSMAVAHLNWMEDNKPNDLEKLYSEKKLKDYLSQKVMTAKQKVDQLMQEGMSRYEAMEIVNGIILSPPKEDAPSKVNPMTGMMRSTIRMSLYE
ncbi:MAG: hypothetical protein Q8862_04520 [Bacteroidota bacterium]|nr:hypothetical protein [Bacteroidota bacterium]MDP4206303.1 hypothetical protein [Bacteroidota bacterium]